MNELETDDIESELSHSVLKPHGLHHGARVGLISPGSRVDAPSSLERARKIIEELGYKPVVGKNALRYTGFTAGTDEERVEDLSNFIADRSIEAIVCLSGGYGTIRLLPLLDFSSLRQNPKILLGSGDRDALLISLNQLTGLVTFHGPNLCDLQDNYTMASLKHTLSGDKRPLSIHCQDDGDESFQLKSFSNKHESTLEGTVLAGNLTVLSSLFGTKYAPSFKGKIVALDDFGERNSILDRWFTTLFLAGSIEEASAFAFGSFADCGPRGANNMLSIEDTFSDRLNELNKAFCFGFKFGGMKNTNYIPIGIHAELDFGKSKLHYKESAFA